MVPSFASSIENKRTSGLPIAGTKGWGGCETMQHKAMNEIFRKGQSDDTTDEKHTAGTQSELRNC